MFHGYIGNVRSQKGKLFFPRIDHLEIKKTYKNLVFHFYNLSKILYKNNFEHNIRFMKIHTLFSNYKNRFFGGRVKRQYYAITGP